MAYRASWMLFDNATGATKPLSETKSATTTIAAPSGLPSSGFVAVDIAADSETYPTWKQPVRAYFRQDGGSWKLVGFERHARQDSGRWRGTESVALVAVLLKSRDQGMRSLALALGLSLAALSLAVSAQTTQLRLVSTAWSPFTNEPGQPRFALDLVEAGLGRIGRQDRHDDR